MRNLKDETPGRHPATRHRPLPIVALVASSLLLVGCFGRATRTETRTDEEASTGTSISLHRSTEKALLERGRQYVMDGRFDQAIAAFTRLYENVEAKPESRAEALLELGRVHSHILNPRRDEAKAVESFQKLADEFPESKLRDEALEKIEQIQPPVPSPDSSS
jgi:outer membrane protein assembly factor BamD (BamD/ComL family)